MPKEIVFVTPYPTDRTIGEGMMQRVKHIDDCLIGHTRTYLNIRLVRAFRKTEIKEEQLTILTLNLFTHFFLILQKFRQADLVYIHSIFNAFPALPFLKLHHRKTKVVLDVHGVVPEELAFSGELKKSRLFSWVEQEAVPYVDTFIYVTHKMKGYYLQKHPGIRNRNHLVYSIKPNMPAGLDQGLLDKTREELDLTGSEVVFIYSGSAQKWQNVDLMFQCIQRLQNPNYRFIILSGEVEAVKAVAEQVSVNTNSFIFRSVPPSMLGYYYALADYGFILRDDHILNRVASPTKLMEYLYFGLTPIVKLQDIGDFADLGYEFLDYRSLNDNLPKRTSQKNKEIVLRILQDPLKIEDVLFQPEALA
ncbi:glycosyltransferase [Rufibacter hautae]|uniref:Glycosyltransferase family 4 protein n=1 Tax=Rufibacter hautae TaxID=2595005 RepID=A0A5B6TH25_9BACT|nr:glycosyltransferase [Rufibacter hautae]KAA3438554.1 glycosyltransferase family 4 protein [Rufibacter hautae]